MWSYKTAKLIATLGLYGSTWKQATSLSPVEGPGSIAETLQKEALDSLPIIGSFRLIDTALNYDEMTSQPAYCACNFFNFELCLKFTTWLSIISRCAQNGNVAIPVLP